MIEPNEPIEIPAKVADGLWVTSFIVTSPSPTQPVRVNITLAPFTSSTGEIFKDRQKTILIEDLFARASEDTVLANAIQTLFAAIQKLNDDAALF
jgi:hypothetical protein